MSTTNAKTVVANIICATGNPAASLLINRPAQNPPAARSKLASQLITVSMGASVGTRGALEAL